MGECGPVCLGLPSPDEFLVICGWSLQFLCILAHFQENSLIQLTSTLAEKISWGFAGLMPILKTVTFGNILVSFG